MSNSSKQDILLKKKTIVNRSRFLALWFTMFVIIGHLSLAQDCHPAFLEFTTSEYIYTCYQGTNNEHLPQQEFINRIRSDAYGALANQFRSNVNSRITKVIDEINYSISVHSTSQTDITTDISLTLAQSKNIYNQKNHEGWVIVYINKSEARGYYLGEYNRAMAQIKSGIDNARAYISKGLKTKARDEELKPLTSFFEQAVDALTWLDLFGFSEERMDAMIDALHEKSVEVKQLLADLQHGVSICLRTNATLMGQPYSSFAAELKGQLQKIGCNFVENPSDADWLLDVDASVSRTLHHEGLPYYAFVDGTLRITNGTTQQVIFTDRISALEDGHPDGIKGAADTRSFAPSARDAYKQASRIVAEKAMEIISQ